MPGRNSLEAARWSAIVAGRAAGGAVEAARAALGVERTDPVHRRRRVARRRGNSASATTARRAFARWRCARSRRPAIRPGVDALGARSARCAGVSLRTASPVRPPARGARPAGDADARPGVETRRLRRRRAVGQLRVQRRAVAPPGAGRVGAARALAPSGAGARRSRPSAIARRDRARAIAVARLASSASGAPASGARAPAGAPATASRQIVGETTRSIQSGSTADEASPPDVDAIAARSRDRRVPSPRTSASSASP